MGSVVLRSIEDLRNYSQSVAARRVEDDPVVRAFQSAKRLAWLAMLVGAFLCYHLIDRMREALGLLG